LPVKKMKIDLRSIDSIRPYERNPRINDQAVAGVAASIKQFGFRKPIVVDVDGVIICGHTCYKAALELKLSKVPVHVARELTPDQVKAYRLADNKTAELAEWDYNLLPMELVDLQQSEFDISSLGFSAEDLAEIFSDQIAEGLTDPDLVPAPPDAATTQPGDLWILGNHRLFCGDSSSPADLDRLLDGAPIHLVNSDPPYNVKVEPRSNNAIAAGLSSFAGAGNHQTFDAARKGKSKPTAAKLRAKDRPLANDFVSDGKFDELLSAWFGNMARVLLPGHAFYIWGGYANAANYPAPLKAAGMYFSQAIIWVKDHPVLTRKDFMGDHEWCFYGWREGAAHRFFGPANLPDVWQLQRITSGETILGKGLRLEAEDGSRLEVSPPLRDKLRTMPVGKEGVTIHGSEAVTDVWRVRKVASQKMVHLTEKPVELAIRAMQYSSRPGEHVLDLFGGSGSTLIAAEQAGRSAFLMELDPLYCDVIVERWEKFTGQKAKRVAAVKAGKAHIEIAVKAKKRKRSA
jgi:DNA modification methylase